MVTPPKRQPAPARGRRKVTEADATEIRRLHGEGLSQSETARRVGVSQQVVSRWSRREGLSWGPAPDAVRTQAERIRLARMELALATLSDIENLRKRLWDNGIEHLVTREGVEAIITDLPSPRATADLAAAAERMARVAEHAASGVGDVLRTDSAVSMLTRLQAQIEQAVADEEAR